jgi:antitoxin VapB
VAGDNVSGRRLGWLGTRPGDGGCFAISEGALQQAAHWAESLRKMNRVDSRQSKSNSTLVRTHVAGFVVDTLPSRVFMNGNSQAVRIPAEFRLSTDRVLISRTQEGDLLIHPCPEQRGQALLQALSGFDAEFVAALEQQQA